MPETTEGSVIPVPLTERILRRTLGAIAALGMLAMTAVTFVDVLGRYALNRPLPGGFEITELLLATIIFAGLPMVSAERSHIAVDLLTERYGPRTRRWNDLGVGIIVAAVLGILAVVMWHKGEDVAAQKDVTAYLALPVAPLAYFISFSCALSALLLLVLAWRDVTNASGASQTSRL
jgi:TRAP-type C4-dicarboxylate transport system permease small subunit